MAALLQTFLDIYIIEIVHQDVFEKWEAMRAVKCAIILDPQQPV